MADPKNLTWGSKEWQDVLAWWTSWCNKPSNLKWKSLKWNWQNIHKNTEKVFIVSSKKMKTSFKYKCISSPKIKKPHHFFYLLVNTLSSHFSIQTSQNLILSVVLMSIRFDLRAHEIDLVLWGFFSITLRKVLSSYQKIHFCLSFHVILLFNHLVFISIFLHSKYRCIFHSHTFALTLSSHDLHMSSAMVGSDCSYFI